jgi:hypothetical protein
VLLVCRFVAVNGLDPDLGAPGPRSENGTELRIFPFKCKNLSATNYAALLTVPTRRSPPRLNSNHTTCRLRMLEIPRPPSEAGAP